MAPRVDINKGILILGVAAIFLFFITSILDFTALDTDDPNAQVFKENVDYGKLTNQVFTYILVLGAVFFAFRLTQGEHRFDRKYVSSIIVLAIILYFLYTVILAPNLGLAPIEYSAYKLQAIVQP